MIGSLVEGDDAGAVGQVGENHLANGTECGDDGGEKTFGMGGVNNDGGGGGGGCGGGTHVLIHRERSHLCHLGTGRGVPAM